MPASTRGALLAAICCLLVAPARAQLAKSERNTPPEALRTFLKAGRGAANGDAEALAEAEAGVDLRDLPQAQHERLTLDLYDLLDRVKLPAFEDLPAEAKGPPVVVYESPDARGRVVLARIRGEWRFDADTVAAVPAMLDEVRTKQRIQEVKAQIKQEEAAGTVAGWLQAHAPRSLRGRAFHLQYWQWAGLVLLLFLGLALQRLVIALLAGLIVQVLKRRKIEVDPEITRSSVRPVGFLAMAGLWWLGLGWLGLNPEVLKVVATAVKFVAAGSAVWCAYRLVDVACSALEKRAQHTTSKFDDLLVPLVRKAGKVIVIGFGLVFVADVLDFEVSSLLAGLGLGGLAFALAAQDTVKNFFGSMTVVLDRPFEVGDWVIVDGVEGSVAEVGLRSTRILTFYNSIVTIPNAKLLTAVVDNMGARKYRRWTTKLTVTYQTSAEKLEAFCEGVRELIRNHPKTRKDYFQVYVNGLGASAIEILLYVFYETIDWTEELQERHRLILDILRLAEALGVEIAYPTQTLHLVRDDGEGQAPNPPPILSHDVGREVARAILTDEDKRDGPGPDGMGLL